MIHKHYTHVVLHVGGGARLPFSNLYDADAVTTLLFSQALGCIVKDGFIFKMMILGLDSLLLQSMMLTLNSFGEFHIYFCKML